MQSDIPPLPISCLAEVRITRASKERLTPRNGKNNLLPKNKYNAILLPNKKRSRPVVGESSPYKNSARLYHPPDQIKLVNKNIVDQRVGSAKMLKIKQLQNQLADAHYHLNELSNENKLLKVIQKRQDAALKKYEGSNAELPRIINTHHEDYRVLETKFKKLKVQHKEICDMLKEKENELHVLQVQNKKLLQLSKDRHLLERDKLQIQVSDLNHIINQQDEVIQNLKRKLSLETKYLKHQLHVEMVKHKETQKNCKDTETKLRNLEILMELREKRSRHAKQATFANKIKATATSQSMVNLNEDKTDGSHPNSITKRTCETSTSSFPTIGNQKSFSKSRSRIGSLHETSSDNVSSSQQSRSTVHPSLSKASTFSSSKGSLMTDTAIQESLLEELIDTQRQIESTVDYKETHNDSELSNQLGAFDLSSSVDHSRPIEDHMAKKIVPNDTYDFTSSSGLMHSRQISFASAEKSENPETDIKNTSLSLRDHNSENSDRSRGHKTMYDRDSVVTVIEKDPPQKMINIDYSIGSDTESEIDIPVDLNNDEDTNIIRKSDLALNHWEPEILRNVSPFSSKLFSPKYSVQDNDNKVEENFKDRDDSNQKLKINFLDAEFTNEEIDKSIDKKIKEKKSSKKKTDPEISSDGESISSMSSTNKKTTQNSITKNIAGDKNPINDDQIESLLDYASKSSSKAINKLPRDEIGRSNFAFKEADKLQLDFKETTETKTVNESSKSFDKAKLLAAMKAIDDNENIEYIGQKSRRNSVNRLQITESLSSGKLLNSKKKSIINELFSNN